MSHEAMIFTALKGLVANRVYPDTFPQAPDKPVWPSIRYTALGGVVDMDACGSGTAQTDSSEWQVDIVSNTATERATLRDQARAAIEAMPVASALNAAPLHLYDPETKTYRAILRLTCYGSTL